MSFSLSESSFEMYMILIKTDAFSFFEAVNYLSSKFDLLELVLADEFNDFCGRFDLHRRFWSILMFGFFDGLSFLIDFDSGVELAFFDFEFHDGFFKKWYFFE